MNDNQKSLTIEQIDARLDVMEQNIIQMHVSLEELKRLIDIQKSEK
jgi:Mg2+ and Co2+ transporter CorA